MTNRTQTKSIINLLESIDRYNIYYGKPKNTFRSREELNFDIEKDGNWVKWEDVEVILQELKFLE